MKSWDEVATLDDPAGWAELGESGWDALLAWAAGSENARRRPSTDVGRTVWVSSERAGVVSGPWREPFTPHDRDLIEDGVNGYLEDAGVPPRPRGYSWFLRVAPSGADPAAFLASISGSVLAAPPETAMPDQWLARMEQVLAEVYRQKSR